MIKKRKTFTKEFKLEAIRLMENSERPSSEIAMELGIRRNQLYKWKEPLDQPPINGTPINRSTGHTLRRR